MAVCARSSVSWQFEVSHRVFLNCIYHKFQELTKGSVRLRTVLLKELWRKELRVHKLLCGVGLDGLVLPPPLVDTEKGLFMPPPAPH